MVQAQQAWEKLARVRAEAKAARAIAHVSDNTLGNGKRKLRAVTKSSKVEPAIMTESTAGNLEEAGCSISPIPEVRNGGNV